ncbi:unnamed protein product [Cunninghamella blakesleeana]
MDSPPPCSTFPHTLEQLLDDTNSELFHDFQHYLEQSYCCENIHFWLDVQEYNDLCQQIQTALLIEEEYHQQNQKEEERFQFLQHQSHLLPSKQQIIFHVVQKKCHAMVDTYIKTSSHQEINIPCELRQELLDQIFIEENYHPSIFNKITKSVIELIRVNAFIPWVSSYPLSPHSPHHYSSSCHPSSATNTTTTTSTQYIQPSSTSLCQTNSSSSTQSSPTSPSFSLDRWYSFSRFRYGRRSCSSLDSNGSIDLLVDPPNDLLENQHTNPTIRCKNMLQKVKHSFLGPQITAIKSTSITTTNWKKA